MRKHATFLSIRRLSTPMLFYLSCHIDRNPILIAISSAGKAPVLVRMIQEKLEALLPTSLGTMATIAGKWRNKSETKTTGFQARCHFWEQSV